MPAGGVNVARTSRWPEALTASAGAGGSDVSPTRGGREVAALTPASPSDLPPLGELVADDPFGRYPSGILGREGVAHLRVWLTAGPEPGTWPSSPKPVS
jgi:hypothetical protein